MSETAAVQGGEFLCSAELPPDVATHMRYKPLAFFEQFILRPDLEVIPASETPPDTVDWCGVYMLFGEDDGLYYIGRSDWVVRRIAHHASLARSGKRRKFAHYGFMPTPWEIAGGIEAAHIQALEPPDNRHVPPGKLPHHDKLVKLIRDAWGEKK